MTVTDDVLDASSATQLYDTIMNTLPLHKDELVMHGGKAVNCNRSFAFFSSTVPDCRFMASYLAAKPMVPLLDQLLASVNTACNAQYTGVFISVFHTGLHYLEPHNDLDEGHARRNASQDLQDDILANNDVSYAHTDVAKLTLGSQRQYKVSPLDRVPLQGGEWSGKQPSSSRSGKPSYAFTVANNKLIHMTGCFQHLFKQELTQTYLQPEPHIILTFKNFNQVSSVRTRTFNRHRTNFDRIMVTIDSLLALLDDDEPEQPQKKQRVESPSHHVAAPEPPKEIVFDPFTLDDDEEYVPAPRDEIVFDTCTLDDDEDDVPTYDSSILNTDLSLGGAIVFV
jgi:hypothetical protein